MTGNNFKVKTGVSLIFKQFKSRSHMSKLDRLSPQDVYKEASIILHTYTRSSLLSTISLESAAIALPPLRSPVNARFIAAATATIAINPAQ